MSERELKAEIARLTKKIKVRASHDDSRAAKLDKELAATKVAHREETKALKKQMGDRIADLEKALGKEAERYREDVTALKNRAKVDGVKASAALNRANASDIKLERARRALG